MTFETDYMTISASSSDASALTLNADKILRQIKVQVTRVELLKGRTPDERTKMQYTMVLGEYIYPYIHN